MQEYIDFMYCIYINHIENNIPISCGMVKGQLLSAEVKFNCKLCKHKISRGKLGVFSYMLH